MKGLRQGKCVKSAGLRDYMIGLVGKAAKQAEFHLVYLVPTEAFQL
jgi:hypothetical protein